MKCPACGAVIYGPDEYERHWEVNLAFDRRLPIYPRSHLLWEYEAIYSNYWYGEW